MKRFVEGQGRLQSTLLPECLDDFITDDNPVRVVEVFIDELDLSALSFRVWCRTRPGVRHHTRRCCSRSTSTAT